MNHEERQLSQKKVDYVERYATAIHLIQSISNQRYSYFFEKLLIHNAATVRKNLFLCMQDILQERENIQAQWPQKMPRVMPVIPELDLVFESFTQHF